MKRRALRCCRHGGSRRDIRVVDRDPPGAKVLAENPILVRLKELEAYKELAGKVGQMHVVLSGDGVLPQLQLKS